MRIYDMSRGEGKTTKCIIELAKNPKSILLVGNGAMKRMIVEQYRGIEDVENRVFAPYEIAKIEQRYRDCDIIIDELEYVLAGLLNHRVKFATITSN
jgi:hypothetical protein